MTILPTVRAPGKLFIAGEYAVVETGMPAILVALDRFVTVSITASEDYGSIISKQYQGKLIWQREGNKMVFDNRDNPFQYILTAIQLTEEYAQQQNAQLKLFHLRVDSQLDSADGKKYGLGSSAAVTVATVKAVCQFYHLNVNKEIIFKIAAIAHLNVQQNGSLGDIAASVYGGWIAYHTFDKEWLKFQENNVTLSELVHMPWPSLSVQQLTPPPELQLVIGWTGSPASTSHLVDRIEQFKHRQAQQYQAFLTASKQCLNRMIAGFIQHNLTAIQKEITINRQLLKHLAALSGVSIETPLLTVMCQSAHIINAVAKASGAGGGDCGIVIANKHQDLQPMLTMWQKDGIEQLPLHVQRIEE